MHNSLEHVDATCHRMSDSQAQTRPAKHLMLAAHVLRYSTSASKHILGLSALQNASTCLLLTTGSPWAFASWSRGSLGQNASHQG